VEVARIDEGLWRWTAPLPSTAGSGEVVGCAFVDTGTEIVVVDPLIPEDPEQAERYWRALDRDRERAGSAPSVVLTMRAHARSAAAVRARYRGAQVLAPDAAREETLARTPVDRWIGPGDVLPAGIEARPGACVGEVTLWVAGHATLVIGHALVGDGRGGVTLSGDVDRETAVARLRPLLDLPVERILPTHGAPVLEGGRAALAAALAP
jgi:hypothetical protein